MVVGLACLEPVLKAALAPSAEVVVVDGLVAARAGDDGADLGGA